MYQSKYIKYKYKYMRLKHWMAGGTKIHQYPSGVIADDGQYKQITMIDGTIYAFNNIDDEKLNENSDFLIGSLTKLFTIIALLKLNEIGIIDITNIVGKYYDDSRLTNVKIIDIINHVSGMKNDSDKYNYEMGASKLYTSATDVFNSMKDETLITKQQGIYAYSNVGYIFLGALIEKITGKNFKVVFEELIFGTLNLIHTGFSEPTTKLYDSSGGLYAQKHMYERAYASSAGQLKSSISDLAKLAEFPKLFTSKTLDILSGVSIVKSMKILSSEHVKLLGNMENITDADHIIMIHGGIFCGKAKLYFGYDNSWVLKRIFKIELRTVEN